MAVGGPVWPECDLKGPVGRDVDGGHSDMTVCHDGVLCAAGNSHQPGRPGVGVGAWGKVARQGT